MGVSSNKSTSKPPPPDADGVLVLPAVALRVTAAISEELQLLKSLKAVVGRQSDVLAIVLRETS